MMFLKIIFLAMTSVFIVGCATNEKVSSLDPKVKDRLNEYSKSVQKYDKVGADVLTPTKYEKINTFFDEATNEAYAGKGFKSIDSTLKQGEKLFPKIEKDFNLAKVHLKKVLVARDQALDEKAESLKSFNEADEELKELGYLLEEKDINEILERRDWLEGLYVKAEIEAIQIRELKGANDIVKATREMESHSFFEKEESIAVKDIESAYILIKKFKDQPGRYMDAVRKAEKSSSRFYALTKTGEWVEKNDVSKIVYRLDSDLNKALKPLAYENTELMSYDEKMAMVGSETETIPFLLDELTAVQYDSYLQHKKVLKLKRKNMKIKEKLASKTKVQKSIEKVRSLFNEDEAKVFVQGDDLIIRLVGLNFGFDKSKLPNGSEQILKKVGNSAKTLNYPDLKIIGHADSKGDPLYNENLSKKRAVEVKKFLVQKTQIESDSAFVMGAGYRKPIAENKTNQGRKSNRRIDIVFNSVVN